MTYRQGNNLRSLPYHHLEFLILYPDSIEIDDSAIYLHIFNYVALDLKRSLHDRLRIGSFLGSEIVMDQAEDTFDAFDASTGSP